MEGRDNVWSRRLIPVLLRRIFRISKVCKNVPSELRIFVLFEFCVCAKCAHSFFVTAIE